MAGKDRYTEYENRKKREKRFSRIHELDSLESMQSRQPHSSAYHDWFEGYAEYRVPAGNAAGYRIERVYAMPYMHAKLLPAKRTARRVLFPVLWLIAAACLAVSAVQDTPANVSAWAVIPTCASIFMLALTAMSVYRYETASENMTVGQYRAASEKLVQRSGLAALCLAADAAGVLAWHFLHAGEDWTALLLFPLVSAAAMLAVWLPERKTEYEKLPNPVELPGDAVLIE